MCQLAFQEAGLTQPREHSMGVESKRIVTYGEGCKDAWSVNDGVIIITVDGRTDRLIHGIANPTSSGVIFAIEAKESCN